MPTFVSFRSHLDILSVSSDLFYDSELQACATDRPQQQLFVRGGCDFLPNPKSPIVFHGVRGKNLQEPDSPSWFNPNEAFQARISCNFSKLWECMGILIDLFVKAVKAYPNSDYKNSIYI